MRRYELIPVNGRKSFNHKAIVEVDEHGTETLYSYGTAIIKRTRSGELVKLWNGWSATTGQHIAAFCGLNKAGFMAMEYESTKTGYLTPKESYIAMIARRAAR